MKDLKHNIDPTYDFTIMGEQKFMYHHGAFNCRKLMFRSASDVIEIMENYDSNALSKKDIKFIVNNANKEVLCYICHRWEDNPDIFVYGDDNIAFQVGCFE